MSKKKQKYYVVWTGLHPGIYNTWAECEQQIKGVAAARFKSYEDLATAQQAFRVGPTMAQSIPTTDKSIFNVDENGIRTIKTDTIIAEKPILRALAVDAACSGNPGVMDYQGVYIETGSRLFHFKYPLGTNNIGEFLAIVHGLAYLQKNKIAIPLYSDSVNAMNWVRAKKCRTKLPLNNKTEQLYDIIHRAEQWLHNNTYSTAIIKWNTELWGEIPADFNRKH